MYGIADCSAETIFGIDCEQLLKTEPYGYAINRGGPGPGSLDTKSPLWGIANDPLKVPGCCLALVKFVDGSPVAIRYHKHDIRMNP